LVSLAYSQAIGAAFLSTFVQDACVRSTVKRLDGKNRGKRITVSE